MALYCHENSVQKITIRIKNKKYNEKLNKAMRKFVRTSMGGWGGGEDMYVPSLNFKYGHFPF